MIYKQYILQKIALFMARDELCCLPFLANAHPTGWLIHFQSFVICRIRYITMFGCMAASFQLASNQASHTVCLQIVAIFSRLYLYYIIFIIGINIKIYLYYSS